MHKLLRIPLLYHQLPATINSLFIPNSIHLSFHTTTNNTPPQYTLSDNAKAYLANQHNTKQWVVDSPYSNEIVASIHVLTNSQLSNKICLSQLAYQQWKFSALNDRVALLDNFCKQIKAQENELARIITLQMGKPITQSLNEINGLILRTHTLIDIALNSDVLHVDQVDTQSHRDNLHKHITKESIGVCCIFAPWNYPLVTIFNSVATAILCGNSILMKHSDRTPLVADMIEQLFRASGAINNLVQSIHINYSQVEYLIQHQQIQYIHFTGSVDGGRAVYSTVAKHRFIDVGLELGGKDAAYVTDECDIKYTAEQIVDGACYNSGQSCCAVERVYVHCKQYDKFIEYVQLALKQYQLGDPLDTNTNFGPIAQPNHPLVILSQINESIRLGAHVLSGGHIVHDKHGNGRFFEPTLIVDCNHTMPIMTDETFGPVIAVQQVDNDNDAIQLINDSQYGLTSSIWCTNQQRTESIASQLDVGTVFMNRCDYLDGYLPWSGRRNSGKGYGLSKYGFLPFLRTKGYNFKIQI